MPPFPDRPVCVIGDVHGRADLLDRMRDRIASLDPSGQARRILVGDLIDRGPASAEVLKTVRALSESGPGHWTCLAGNHERMMLDFLGDPVRHGLGWLMSGGEATLRSCGLSPPSSRNRDAALIALADDLAAALGAGMITWLRDRPLIWQEGALVVSHAGIDPCRPLADQDEAALLWGQRIAGRRRHHETAGLWSVQGHVVHDHPVMRGRTIHVDTGAWSTGRLSAAWLEAGQSEPRWITVQDEDG